MSPYTISKPFCHWIFPTSVERLAMVGEAVERGKVAWQQDDDSFWVLTAIPGTWIRLSNKLPIAISDVTALQTALDGKEPKTDWGADLTMYVRTDGSDTNDGLANTAGRAMATVQACLSYWAVWHPSPAYNLFIILGNTGTFAGASMFREQLVTIRGDILNSANTVLGMINGADAANLTIEHLKLDAPTDNYLLNLFQTQVAIGEGVIFGSAIEAHIGNFYSSEVFAYADYEIVGSSKRHFYGWDGGIVEGGYNTITLTGTPNFSVGFVDLEAQSNIYFSNATFVGAATGPKFTLTNNSLCYTGTDDVNYFPGNVAGTLDVSSSYDGILGIPPITKATPVAADHILIVNSATGFVEKTLWKNTGHIGTFTSSTLPAAASYTECTLLCSDVGPAPGSMLISNGTRWRPVNGTALLTVLPSRVSRAGGAGILQALSTLLPLGLIKPGDALIVPFGCSKAGINTAGTSSYRIGTAGTTADTLISVGFTFPAANQSGGGTHRICIESDTSANSEGVPGGIGGLGGFGGGAYPSAVTLAGGVAFSTHNLYFGISITPGATDAIALEKATVLWEAI